MSRGLFRLWLVLSVLYIAISGVYVYQSWQRVYYEENTYARVGTRFEKLSNIDWNKDRCVPVGSKSQGLSPVWSELATLCTNFDATFKAGGKSLQKQFEASLRGVAPTPNAIYGFTAGGIDGKLVKVTKVAGQNPCPRDPDAAGDPKNIFYYKPMKTSQGHILCVSTAQIYGRGIDLNEQAFKQQIGLNKIHKALFYTGFLTTRLLLVPALLFAALFAGLWVVRGFK